MIFVDEARIFVKGGDGGLGCESFYRDKFMRYPRPDGGNGGTGGNIIIIADKNIQTLLDFKYKQHYQGNKGGNASSKGKTGKTGADAMLKVPVGTIIRDLDNDLLIKDLKEDQQSVTVARGGTGGIGNQQKKVSATPPKPGEERTIGLELKLIADVGIVGFPNAGKSTLISNISKVKSKIANYPFTTKKPILGIVQTDDFSFVVADLPGIIEGAHKGKGLGDRFLRHAERTKILIHLIDMAGVDQRDPLDDYEKIEHELREYGGRLPFKTKLLVANKMDVPEAEKNLKRFKKKFPVEILSVSALENKGLKKLVDQIVDILCSESSPDQ
ncbi:MAG: GTPase ObgE [Candidatus Omnitrophica bacterium]|nr:GTPase ObgE [Candidatus Omnitrophota bacterium]